MTEAALAEVIAEGAIGMVTRTKAKVAAICVAIGLPLVLVGAVLYAGTGNATPNGTPAQPTPSQQAATRPAENALSNELQQDAGEI